MQLCAKEGTMDVHELLYLYTTDLHQSRVEPIKLEHFIKASTSLLAIQMHATLLAFLIV